MSNSEPLAKFVHLRTAVDKVRTGMFENKEYLVVPLIALMEGVIHAINADEPEFVPMGSLRSAPQGWNGRPVMYGHPAVNGRQISANDPKVLEESAFGKVFSTRIEGNKLLMEAWVDEARAKALGGEDMVAKIRNGESVEVSVGAFVVTEPSIGTFGDKPYKHVWKDIIPDHLAFLPKGVGACSIKMGCGTNRALAEGHLVDDAVLETLGGPGSGNFGHEGRPGQRGGSSDGDEGGGGKTPKEGTVEVMNMRGKKGTMPSNVAGADLVNRAPGKNASSSVYGKGEGQKAALDAEVALAKQGYTPVKGGATRGVQHFEKADGSTAMIAITKSGEQEFVSVAKGPKGKSAKGSSAHTLVKGIDAKTGLSRAEYREFKSKLAEKGFKRVSGGSDFTNYEDASGNRIFVPSKIGLKDGKRDPKATTYHPMVGGLIKVLEGQQTLAFTTLAGASLNDRINAVNTAVQKKWNLGQGLASSPSSYVYAQTVFDDRAIVQKDDKYYSVPYTVVNEEVVFGEPVEVEVAYVRAMSGQGSGNFNHKGRPGERGGSESAEGAGSDDDITMSGPSKHSASLKEWKAAGMDEQDAWDAVGDSVDANGATVEGDKAVVSTVVTDASGQDWEVRAETGYEKPTEEDSEYTATDQFYDNMDADDVTLSVKKVGEPKLSEDDLDATIEAMHTDLGLRREDMDVDGDTSDETLDEIAQMLDKPLDDLKEYRRIKKIRGLAAAKVEEEQAKLKAASSREGEGQMTKEQKDATIKTLMEHKHSGFTSADQKMLEAASDERLESFKVAADARAVEVKALEEAKKPVPLTEEAFMAVAPPELKSLIERTKAADTALKTDLVTALKACQSEYSESELAAMDIESLKRLARVAKLEEEPRTYEGRGVPRALADNKTDVFANPPDPYKDALEAMRKAS